MKKIDIFKITYCDINVSIRTTSMIRGYFATKYNEIDKMHNHKENNYIYRYPVIQYKVIDNNPVLLGINEGANILKEKLIYLEDEITIGDLEVISQQRKIERLVCDIGECDKIIKYEFLTPWVALNQNNIKKYIEYDIIDKEMLLQKILIGNILSFCKGIGYTVDKKLKVKLDLKETKVILKGNSMVGFIGIFYTNFELPNYIGIGKSISRGFGTIKKSNYNKD